jgi:hypothetical protein
LIAKILVHAIPRKKRGILERVQLGMGKPSLLVHGRIFPKACANSYVMGTDRLKALFLKGRLMLSFELLPTSHRASLHFDLKKKKQNGDK